MLCIHFSFIQQVSFVLLHVPCGKPMPVQTPGRTCGPKGVLAGVLAGAVTLQGPTLALFLMDCTQWEGPHAGEVHEELKCTGRNHVGSTRSMRRRE